MASAKDKLSARLTSKYITNTKTLLPGFDSDPPELKRLEILTIGLKKAELSTMLSKLRQIYQEAQPNAEAHNVIFENRCWFYIPTDMADILNETQAAEALKVIYKIDHTSSHTEQSAESLRDMLGARFIDFDTDRNAFTVILPNANNTRDRGKAINHALGGNEDDPLCWEIKVPNSFAPSGFLPALCIPQDKIRDFFGMAHDHNYPNILKNTFKESRGRLR